MKLRGLIPIEPTRGVADVYFVFGNSAAEPSDALMTLKTVEFVLGE